MNNVELQLQDLRNSVQILADNLTLKGIESSPNDGLTALVAKVQMIGGGAAVMTLSIGEDEEREGNCYLVRTIEEMNALENVTAGQYCLIYDYNNGNVIFNNAYIYMDDIDTEEEDLAWRILNYKLSTGADKVFKEKTFLGPDGVRAGELWSEATWATSGKIPNSVLITIKNVVGAIDDWSNLFKNGQDEEYLICKIMDGSGVSNFSSMFENCNQLKNLAKINTSSATDLTNILKGCSALENFEGFAGLGTNFIVEKVRLPEEYTELTYVYSNTGNASTTGTQYIDTGIKASNKLKIELKFRASQNSYNMGLFGAQSAIAEADATDSCALAWRYQGVWGLGHGVYYALDKASGTTSTGTIYTAIYDRNNCYIYNNSGTLLQTLSGREVEDFESPYNIWLGSINKANNRWGACRGYYYYCKIWDDGELVRDFVPATNTSTGIVGFYDLVEGAFYSSIGGTNFYAGGTVSVVYGVEQTDEQIVNLSDCINLSHDSLVKIIGNLYNIKSRTTETAKIILGETNLAKLTDAEKAVATNKGWVLE